MPRTLAPAVGLLALALLESTGSIEPLGSVLPTILGLLGVCVVAVTLPILAQRRVPIALASQARGVVTIAVTIAFVVAASLGRWWDHCATWFPPEIPSVHRIAAAIPLIAALWLAHRLDRRGPQGTAWRPMLILGLPYLVFTGVLDLGWHFPGVQEAFALDSVLGLFGLVALFATLLWSGPRLIGATWPHRAFPPGEVREVMEAVARDAGVKIGDIRVWETPLVNACVTGLNGRQRRVFVTQGLFQLLRPEEIIAVHAHEVAHIRNGHLWLLLGWLTSGFLILVAIDPWLGAPLSTARLVNFSVLGIVGLLGFARLSHHFEHEADHFAATVRSPEDVAAALRKVSFAPKPRRTFWRRHPSVDERLEWIEASRDPAVVKRFTAKTRRIGWAIGITVFLAMGAFGWSTIALNRDRGARDLDRGWYLFTTANERAFRSGEYTGVERDMLERAGESFRSALERSSDSVLADREAIEEALRRIEDRLAER